MTRALKPQAATWGFLLFGESGRVQKTLHEGLRDLHGKFFRLKSFIGHDRRCRRCAAWGILRDAPPRRRSTFKLRRRRKARRYCWLLLIWGPAPRPPGFSEA